MANNAYGDDDEISNINVVPLVDVMLVLLTIVLTTATFVVNGRIPVDLARAASAEPIIKAPLVLTMTADRRLFLGDQPITSVQVALQGQTRDKAVVVRADASLPLGPFVELVDQVKSMGHTQVSLEVRRS